MKKNKYGFTLIELLVVISIIGILTAIVLVSLDASKKKGIDARVKSEMKSFATAAELYRSNCGNYVSSGIMSIIASAFGSNGAGSGVPSSVVNDVCFTQVNPLWPNAIFSSNIGNSYKLLSDIILNIGEKNWLTSPTKICGAASRSAWALAVKLNNGYWCVDSAGSARDKSVAGVLYSQLNCDVSEIDPIQNNSTFDTNPHCL